MTRTIAVRRIVAGAFTVLATLGAGTAASTPASAAADDPSLGCQLIGNTNFISGGFHQNSCSTIHPDSSYVLDYGLSNARDFTTWTIPSGFTPVAGCTSGFQFCDLVIRSGPVGHSVTVSVTTDNAAGVPVTVSATATTPEVCGRFIC